jgi:sialate O-acetylesterase
MAYKKAINELREWIPLAEDSVERGLNPPALPRFPPIRSGNREPTQIYNSMIHPLIPFAIRGAIWYQGESNGSEGVSYYHKKQALIGGWRTLWNQGDFPFYFVQLANYGKPTDDPAGGDGYSHVREAQRQSLAIKNTGMAGIIDIGEAGNIHPANKQDVGLRLALWALGNEYGRKNLIFCGPLFKSSRVEQGAIRVTFEHAGSGLMAGIKNGLDPVTENPEGVLKRFAIAGEDRQWHWADARIDGTDSVLVSSPSVPSPVAVRYAFSHNPEGCNLYNREGLPASPFRTDDW